MKQFLSVNDVANVSALVECALRYKADPFADRHFGAGKRLGLLFMNPSLRTRISTQAAASNLGLECMVLNGGQDSWQLEFEDGAMMNGTSVEHVKDAARVFGEYFDIIGVRSFPSLKDKTTDDQETVIRSIAKYAQRPVVSLESALLHPLQSLADVITVKENWKEKRKPKIVLSWAPHVKAIPHCVANSFAQWINAWSEAEFVITHPEGYELDETYTGNASISYDQREALQDADFVYVKNWSSVKQYGQILTDDPSWMLTSGHLKATNDARVMHCLPVRRNVELSDEVLDSDNSIVTQQAGNRLWAAQAVLSSILKQEAI